MHGFELGSVHYDHYVVNIRLPSRNSDYFGRLTTLTVVVSCLILHWNSLVNYFENRLITTPTSDTCIFCTAVLGNSSKWWFYQNVVWFKNCPGPIVDCCCRVV
jgi:hypothetical protein